MNNADYFKDDFLDSLVEFQLLNPEVYIGGSVALMLQQAIPYRKPKDLDLVTFTEKTFAELKGISRRRAEYGFYGYVVGGMLCELMCDPEPIELVEYKHGSGIIRLGTIDRIVYWKNSYAERLSYAESLNPMFGHKLIQSIHKHMEDIDHINNNIK